MKRSGRISERVARCATRRKITVRLLFLSKFVARFSRMLLVDSVDLIWVDQLGVSHIALSEC